MNIMNRLTKKHMISNKKRTIMTLLGVIVSVAMLTAVSTAMESFKAFMQQFEMSKEGYWHVAYQNFPVKELETIEKDGETKNYFLTKELLYGRVEGEQVRDKSKPFLYLQGFTKESMEEMKLRLAEGRFPETDDEIALPEHLRFENGKRYKVGDQITVEIGQRFLEALNPNQPLGQNTVYRPENMSEDFRVIQKKTYTVTGMIERPSYERYGTAGYTSVTYLNTDTLIPDDTVCARVFLNNVTKKLYSDSKELAQSVGLTSDDVIYNRDALVYYGVTPSSGFNQMLLMLELVLNLIIIVGRVSLIYNSFAISITERRKQFGMLASVGATKQQKRNAIFYEGAVIGGIAIPIGVLSGIGGMWVTFAFVGSAFRNMLSILVNLELRVSLHSILIAVLFSIVTIFISAYIPAIRASKISAIDAIRQTKDIKLSGKKVKTSKLTRRIFGLEGELALKNLKRNKKRFRALVFSLFISFVLFISVSSYVYYVRRGLSIAQGTSDYDISISFHDTIPEKTLFSKLKEIEGVQRAAGLTGYQTDASIEKAYLKKHITAQCLKARERIYELHKISEEQIAYMNGEGLNYSVDFMVLEQESYEEYCKELGISADAVEKAEGYAAIIVNRHDSLIGYSVTETEVLDVKKQDMLPVVMGDKKVEIEVAAVADYLPMKVHGSGVDGAVILVMPEKQVESIKQEIPEAFDSNVMRVYFYQVKDALNIDDSFDEVLKRETDGNYFYTNAVAHVQKSKQLMMVMSVFTYGFITLISLICIANLCNTIRTSFILRRREFAMLKSVGMTPRAFQRMILYESLFYGLKALLYGIPVSVLITYEIYKMVNENIMSGFIFPWMEYGIGLAAVFIVVGAAMKYSSLKIKDESIIDGLKSEKI